MNRQIKPLNILFAPFFPGVQVDLVAQYLPEKSRQHINALTFHSECTTYRKTTIAKHTRFTHDTHWTLNSNNEGLIKSDES